MNSLLTPFIVLIERRRLGRRLLAALTALAVLATGPIPASAQARQPGYDRVHKVARDLDEEATRIGMPKAKWARDVNGVRHVQAIVVSNGIDPADDRSAQLRAAQRRLRARHPSCRACDDGAAQGQSGTGAGTAQRCGQHLAEPRRPAHGQHARIDHRRTVEQRAQRQHQDQLHRARRHGHRHRRARFGRHEGARHVPERQRIHAGHEERQHAQRHACQLDRGCRHDLVAQTRQQHAEQLRERDQRRLGDDPGSVRPRHPRCVGRRRPRQVLRRGHARHHRHRAECRHLRRPGARRLWHRHDERCARRHPVGHLPRQGTQHPRAQRQPGGRLDGILADRPAVCGGAQRRRGRHHGGGGGRQLRPVDLRPGGLRCDQRAGQRSLR